MLAYSQLCVSGAVKRQPSLAVIQAEEEISYPLLERHAGHLVPKIKTLQPSISQKSLMVTRGMFSSFPFLEGAALGHYQAATAVPFSKSSCLIG